MKLAYASPRECTPSARPFLKWAGGKTQLLGELLSRFPETFNRYHEPFLGGGAVFFALQPKRAVLSDINPDLIAAYQAIRDDVDAVMRHLHRHRADPEHFYKVRALKTNRMKAAARAARIIYLNRTCFNGLYRVNQRGQFNVPYGRYANPKICNRDNLLAVANTLKSAVLRNQSVLNIARQVRRNDLVYFDPPYDPVSLTASFTGYTRGGFGREAQERLAKLFLRLAERGVHVVLSNADTPFVRQLYRGCRIERVMARRAINSRADRRGVVGEVIVTAR
jgi:DNA adenine methylase